MAWRQTENFANESVDDPDAGDDDVECILNHAIFFQFQLLVLNSAFSTPLEWIQLRSGIGQAFSEIDCAELTWLTAISVRNNLVRQNIVTSYKYGLDNE